MSVLGIKSKKADGIAKNDSTAHKIGGARKNMLFTSLGVYTPASEQTFRVGITPDIRVERTIQGVTDGRDEIMEAAIRFILGER